MVMRCFLSARARALAASAVPGCDDSSFLAVALARKERPLISWGPRVRATRTVHCSCGDPAIRVAGAVFRPGDLECLDTRGRSGARRVGYQTISRCVVPLLFLLVLVVLFKVKPFLHCLPVQQQRLVGV